jgi:redox-sensitive bicupin YhaK (pirin superfamily)
MRSKKIVEYVIPSRETLEGAGVRLKRAFGDPLTAKITDPFLLLDDFGSRNPHEYLMGFPWHPHRGFQTITYLIKGEVHHEDSTGVKGVIRSGDLQWMVAGSGIFHSEMPRPGKKIIKGREVEDPDVRGLQLWVNLPRSLKMRIPEYRNLPRENMPTAILDNGVVARVVAGVISRVPGYGRIEGPVKDLGVDVGYMDLTIPAGEEFSSETKEGFTAIVYVLEGSIVIWKDENEVKIGPRKTIVFSREGSAISIRGGPEGGRALFLVGKPIEEPIAWYGPIVMSTEEELLKAFEDLRRGTFVKHKATVYDYFRN